jgi:hypothetical protein
MSAGANRRATSPISSSMRWPKRRLRTSLQHIVPLPPWSGQSRRSGRRSFNVRKPADECNLQELEMLDAGGEFVQPALTVGNLDAE